MPVAAHLVHVAGTAESLVLYPQSRYNKLISSYCSIVQLIIDIRESTLANQQYCRHLRKGSVASGSPVNSCSFMTSTEAASAKVALRTQWHVQAHIAMALLDMVHRAI